MIQKINRLLSLVVQHFPALNLDPDNTIEEGGQFSQVLIANDEYVFRFPRYPHVAESMRAETHLLRALQAAARFPLRIPDPSFSHTQDPDWQHVFMGYPKIPGQPLWRQTLESLPESIQQRLAEQIAGFLNTLHSLPYPPSRVSILPDDFPVHDSHASLVEMYAAVRDQLYPHIRPAAREEVSCRYESFLSASRPYTPCPRHGDFGPSNLLYDAKRRSMSGVIDFSFCAISDPAEDIAGALTYGEDFVRRLIPIYPEVEGMLERARFYKFTYALQEALDGLRDGDKQAFERGIERFR